MFHDPSAYWLSETVRRINAIQNDRLNKCSRGLMFGNTWVGGF